MDYKDGVDVKRQSDMGMLALAYTLIGEESKADHLRAIARARYEAELRRDVKEAAIA